MKAVRIDWYDSHGPRRNEWQAMEDIDIGNRPLLCHSLGWVRYEDDDCIKLIPHVGAYDDPDFIQQGRGALTIPRQAIQRCQELNEGDLL